jgi:hypothetical protein
MNKAVFENQIVGRCEMKLRIGLVAGALMCAMNARAQIVLYDGTFLPQNWTSTKLVDTTAGHAATFTASQQLPGGDPGAYRRIIETVPTAGTIITGNVSNQLYSPSVQGPIGTIRYSYDLEELNPPFPGAQVNYALLLLQNGQYYVPTTMDFFGNLSWQGFCLCAPNALTASDFSNMFEGLLLPGGGPPHPNFSSSGGPIRFGYFTSNSSLGASFTTTSGIDNWTVDIAPKLRCTLNDTATYNAATSTLTMKFNVGNNLGGTPFGVLG